MSDPRLLGSSDIGGAMRLKEAAGWNQTERDWMNLLKLEPEGCFGIEHDGVLAATATAVCHGRDLAWIGMVLTAPEFRGRGYARRLMEHAIGFLRTRGVAWIKLDATDMGRPLYAKLGFEDECPIERWRRTGAWSGPRTRDAAYTPLPALDREAFGADRSAVVASVAVETAAVGEDAYAMGRPGSKAAYFGPCVSRSVSAARQLAEWFLARHAGEDVFWDLLPGNREAAGLARELGFEPCRRLMRMALPAPAGTPPLSRNDSLVYAIAGLEFG